MDTYTGEEAACIAIISQIASSDLEKILEILPIKKSQISKAYHNRPKHNIEGLYNKHFQKSVK